MPLFRKKKPLETPVDLNGVFERAGYKNASVAMMTVDRDMVITGVNKASEELFRTHAYSFRQLDPTFDPETVVGTCIDRFHKNPDHQRKILSDPANLPYETTISIDPFFFDLKISSVRESGAFVLEWRDVTQARQNRFILESIEATQARIVFAPDGSILDANTNFLDVMGYDLNECLGKNHRIFMHPAERASSDYVEHWRKLKEGRHVEGVFRRIAKSGANVWLHAAYYPIVDTNNKVIRIVKYGVDVTEAESKNAEYQGKLSAIELSQAIAEFTPDGDVISANGNFCKVMEYSPRDVEGRHHRVFVPPEQRESAAYKEFLQNFRAGKFQAARYERVTKSGRRVWLQATYNPILDAAGALSKIVEFATDVTDEVLAAERRERDQKRVVSALASGLQALSDGRFAARIDEDFPSEYVQLRSDFNSALDTLSATIKDVIETAESVGHGATGISEAAVDLSKRTETQAATLEQTAAAVDEIAATVRESSENAAAANGRVADASAEAQKSGDVVKRAIDAMEAIETSSSQISQIIGVIDEIAFQTNLLALNAGVEAARAGDAGRGFAVVAQEVRALAQRSSEAAKEIKGFIAESSEHVKVGVDLVGDAGDALVAIVDRVRGVSELVSLIATSTNEQSRSVTEVNSAMVQIDAATQQTAAMVEETTAASHSLMQDAKELSRRMRQFEIGSPNGVVAPPLPAASGVKDQVARAQSFVAANEGSAALDQESDWSEF